jgi:hypothetical protein
MASEGWGFIFLSRGDGILCRFRKIRFGLLEGPFPFAMRGGSPLIG